MTEVRSANGRDARDGHPTGAQLVARALAAAGVRRVFSLSGNQVLPLYDALLGEAIAIVHTRHEGAAVHMADAWSRLTGEAGVCLVTAGPGHANALGALSMAEAGESPVLLLSGHSPVAQAGMGAFQEMDQVALARPLTRWAEVARRPEDLPALVATALRMAAGGRPGPAHLSLPVDVLNAAATPRPASLPAADDTPAGGQGPISRPGPAPISPPAGDETSELPAGEAAYRPIVDLLRSGQRPLVLGGPACARPGVYESLDAFSRLTGIPFLILDHPRGLADPALGRAGAAVPRADAVLLLAKRQDYRLAFGGPGPLAADCRLAQIDPWPPEIGRPRPAAASMVADARTAARGLLAAARTYDWPPTRWAEEVQTMREAPLVEIPPERLARAPLHPWLVCDALAALVERTGADRTRFVLDGGEFGQWARARLRLRPPRHLVAEPSGGIGFAVPAALAAKLAFPGDTIVAVAGDGGFGFYALELETAARCGAPFLAVVGVDGAWGTERHLQIARYGPGRAVATDLLPVRYDQLATALDGHGEYVAQPADLSPALHRAMAAVARGRPAVVCVRLASEPSPAGGPP